METNDYLFSYIALSLAVLNFMCALFRNKYRIGSKRYPEFDYSSNGKYFVTVCTKNKIPFFGRIENGIMKLSELGICLQNEWLKTPAIRPDMNITVDEFVVMPDHFHAIIIIGENRFQSDRYHNKFSPQIKNLSSIIRGIKSAVTVYAKINELDFKWQQRFHDHIIRTNTELIRIRKYILENPQKWKCDKHNSYN